MSILESMFGSDPILISDKDIAFDILKDSKFGVSTLSKATLESVNPQLRQMLDAHLAASIGEHHKLSDILIQKNWYPAAAAPDLQLKNALAGAESISQTIQNE
ncbi:MAG: spore coat protein [Bacillota bacterium]|nr:spore coat protein [Bacillota bacterium]